MFIYKDLSAKSSDNYLSFDLEYEAKTDECQVSVDVQLKKTKSPDTLILTLNNINYLTPNNLQYLEVEKLKLMMILQIFPISSNFSYELESKSNSGST